MSTPTERMHWRDRLALRFVAWLAATLMTDAIGDERREEFGSLRTSLHMDGMYGD